MKSIQSKKASWPILSDATFFFSFLCSHLRQWRPSSCFFAGRLLAWIIFVAFKKQIGSAQQLGLLYFFLMVQRRSKVNSNSRILFCSISPTEEVFKRSVDLADPTQVSTFLPLSLGMDVGLHTHPVKRSIIAHSLQTSGWEAFHRYFWHALSQNHTRWRGDYSLLSPCLSELGSGWQEMDVSNSWATPFRKERRWQKERCLIKNAVFFFFHGRHSCKHQTLTGSDFLSAFNISVPQIFNLKWRT